MITNTLREASNPDDFLGHLTPTEFVLIVPQANLAALQEHLRSRLEQSLDYFYPIKDREQVAKRKNRLGIKMAKITSASGSFESADQIKLELLRLKQ